MREQKERGVVYVQEIIDLQKAEAANANGRACRAASGEPRKGSTEAEKSSGAFSTSWGPARSPSYWLHKGERAEVSGVRLSVEAHTRRPSRLLGSRTGRG